MNPLHRPSVAAPPAASTCQASTTSIASRTRGRSLRALQAGWNVTFYYGKQDTCAHARPLLSHHPFAPRAPRLLPVFEPSCAPSRSQRVQLRRRARHGQQLACVGRRLDLVRHALPAAQDRRCDGGRGARHRRRAHRRCISRRTQVSSCGLVSHERRFNTHFTSRRTPGVVHHAVRPTTGRVMVRVTHRRTRTSGVCVANHCTPLQPATQRA